MENNDQKPVEPEKPGEPELNPNDPLDKRFNLDERETKEIVERANKVKDVKEASVESLEILYHSLRETDPNTAQMVLNELNSRGTIQELLKKEQESINEMRRAHKLKDMEELKSKVVNEPMGSTANTAKLLKLKNVKMPDLFSKQAGHAGLMNQGIDKIRQSQKKKDK